MKGPLGKKVATPNRFDPKVLFPISRTEQRKGVFDKTDITTIKGDDVWNIYELLWIDKNNNSHHNELSISLNCFSKNTIESKSMKLYSNSFYNKDFKKQEQVIQRLKSDLKTKMVTPDISFINKFEKYQIFRRSKADFFSLLILTNLKKRRMEQTNNPSPMP